MNSFHRLRNKKKKALIITAHPDDETIFIGGTMAEFKKWNWTVLCVTDCDERRNKRRRQELLQACRIYKRGSSSVTPFMLGIVKRKGRFSKKEIKEKVRDFINGFGPFDIIFTHNTRGEYGHKTHRLIHNAVMQLKLRNLYNFSLHPLLHARTVKLSPKSRLTKRKAINVYLKGSQKTNLSKIKKVVKWAIEANSEVFHSVN